MQSDTLQPPRDATSSTAQPSKRPRSIYPARLPERGCPATPPRLPTGAVQWQYPAALGLDDRHISSPCLSPRMMASSACRFPGGKPCSRAHGANRRRPRTWCHPEGAGSQIVPRSASKARRGAPIICDRYHDSVSARIGLAEPVRSGARWRRAPLSTPLWSPTPKLLFRRSQERSRMPASAWREFQA